jgi:sugar phosphate isomerase/epimerase
MQRFVFPLLGEGKVDWRAFKQALIDIGYKGVMSVEFESFSCLEKVLDGNMEEAARISIRDIRKLFAK